MANKVKYYYEIVLMATFQKCDFCETFVGRTYNALTFVKP